MRHFIISFSWTICSLTRTNPRSSSLAAQTNNSRKLPSSLTVVLQAVSCRSQATVQVARRRTYGRLFFDRHAAAVVMTCAQPCLHNDRGHSLQHRFTDSRLLQDMVRPLPNFNASKTFWCWTVTLSDQWTVAIYADERTTCSEILQLNAHKAIAMLPSDDQTSSSKQTEVIKPFVICRATLSVYSLISAA